MIRLVVSAACILHNFILQHDGFLLHEVGDNEVEAVPEEIEVYEEQTYVHNVTETRRNSLAPLLV